VPGGGPRRGKDDDLAGGHGLPDGLGPGPLADGSRRGLGFGLARLADAEDDLVSGRGPSSAPGAPHAAPPDGGDLHGGPPSRPVAARLLRSPLGRSIASTGCWRRTAVLWASAPSGALDSSADHRRADHRPPVDRARRRPTIWRGEDANRLDRPL